MAWHDTWARSPDVDCEQAKYLLPGYIDRELDLVHSVELEEHLEGCSACTLAHEQQQALQSAIGSASLSYRAPTELRKRLQSQLRGLDEPKMTWNRRLRSNSALATAAMLLVAATWAIGHNWAGNKTDGVIDQVVASHVRSLLVDHVADVASSDRHQVKPWFNGKLDYAPEFDDFASQGFPLTGGRLDYVNHRPVAAMVYGRRKHVINLFCWPATGERTASIQLLDRQGYHLAHWVKSGLEFWAVSDLNAAELRQFAELLQASGTDSAAN
jgi:anti-sigma factor RsiW